MPTRTKNHLIINNQKYFYFLQLINNKKTRVTCPAANIDQEFLNQDIPHLLIDLPELIIAEQNYETQPKEVIRFRISPEDKKRIILKATQKGFSNVSEYLRQVAINS